MTPTVMALHQRSKRFHADIARRAALVPQKEDRSFAIPNTPFGVKKVQPMLPTAKPLNQEPLWWHSMWFYDLVMITPKGPTALSIGKVLEAVSNHYGLPKSEIVSRRRTYSIVRPRQVCYYLAKKLTLRSLPEIGRRLGDRDHTSILSGIRKIEELRQTDLEIDRDVRKIAADLGGLLS